MFEKHIHIRGQRITVSWINPFEWDELVADYQFEESWWHGFSKEFKSLRLVGLEITVK